MSLVCIPIEISRMAEPNMAQEKDYSCTQNITIIAFVGKTLVARGGGSDTNLPAIFVVCMLISLLSLPISYKHFLLDIFVVRFHIECDCGGNTA